MVLKTHKRRELLMIKHVKRPKKYRVLEKLKKLGIKNRRATNKELELLYKGLHVKYCRNLEDNIIQDSYIIANLQKTIYFQQQRIDEHKKFSEALVDKYENIMEDLERQLEEAHKGKNEAIKDYRALWDLKELADSPPYKHHPLPEDQNQKEFIKKNYNLEVKGQTLESGRLGFRAKMKQKTPLQKLAEEKLKKNGKGPEDK